IKTADAFLSLSLVGDRLQHHDCIQLCRGPELSRGDGHIIFQPHAFNLPGMTVISSVVDYGTEYQWDNFQRCEAAIAAIERYAPAVYDDFWASMRLIGLKPEEEGTVYNTSCSRLTGASILTAYSEPLVLAEDLIHEFHHNRLFAVEDHEPFFDNAIQDAVGEEVFYSPWREDPRPLYGLFHAMHVFTSVGHFWLSVYQLNNARAECREYAASRLARLQVQLSCVETQLRSFAAFTPFGQMIFDELCDKLARLNAGIDACDISLDVSALVPEIDGSFTNVCDEESNLPLTIGEVLQQHAEQYDVHGCCGDSLGNLKRGVITLSTAT
ncbi:MAG: aKG-HExxH-type peptide beta-hydroxylase, partial [Aeoliella sp.]